MIKEKNVGIVLASLAVLLWSTVAVVFKLGLKVYSSFELLFISTIFSTLTLILFVLIFKRSAINFTFNQKSLFQTLIQALLNPFLYYIVLFTAYKQMPAQIAQSINFTWPIFLSVFAAIVFKEKIKRYMYVALLISFAGVVIVSRGSAGLGGDYKSSSVGVLLCLISAVVWSLYWVLSAKDLRPPVIKLMWAFVVSLVYIVVFGIVTKQLPKVELSNNLFYPLYIGLFEMSITFLIWIIAIQKAKSTPLLGNLAYLVPVVSLFFIRMVLKEEIQSSTIVGLILIVSGVVLQARMRKLGRK